MYHSLGLRSANDATIVGIDITNALPDGTIVTGAWQAVFNSSDIALIYAYIYGQLGK